jgi:hypothetical protein
MFAQLKKQSDMIIVYEIIGRIYFGALLNL